MQIKSLRIFLAVCDSASFGAAAQQLHTVQSNVTAHIKKLEQELGVQLLERRSPVRPTSAGQTLLAQASALLQAHDATCALFAGTGAPAGRLRIGAMESTAALRLPPVLAGLYRDWPQIEMQLQTGSTAVLLEALAQGQLDCALVAGAPPGWWARPVFLEELVLVGPQPMTQMPTPEALLHTPFLAFRQGCSYRQRIELLLASQGITAARIMEFGTLDAILGCVAAGMGLALMPQSLMQAHQARFAVHCLRLPQALRAELAEVTTYLVCAEESGWSPALRAWVARLPLADGAGRGGLDPALALALDSALD